MTKFQNCPFVFLLIACNNSVIKFDILGFCYNLSQRSTFGWNKQRVSDATQKLSRISACKSLERLCVAILGQTHHLWSNVERTRVIQVPHTCPMTSDQSDVTGTIVRVSVTFCPLKEPLNSGYATGKRSFMNWESGRNDKAKNAELSVTSYRMQTVLKMYLVLSSWRTRFEMSAYHNFAVCFCYKSDSNVSWMEETQGLVLFAAVYAMKIDITQQRQSFVNNLLSTKIHILEDFRLSIWLVLKDPLNCRLTEVLLQIYIGKCCGRNWFNI